MTEIIKEKDLKLPKKWVEVLREMNVGDAIDITEKGQSVSITQAKKAFPKAEFKTRWNEDKTKLYLIRKA